MTRWVSRHTSDHISDSTGANAPPFDKAMAHTSQPQFVQVTKVNGREAGTTSVETVSALLAPSRASSEA